MDGRELLTLENVTVRYGATVAVDGLSLNVRRGEVLGLLGPNGSGKSTTLDAIAGLITPCAGSIRVDGLAPKQFPLEYRRRIGVVPQELAFYDELSGLQNLYFFGRLYGVRGRALALRAQEVLEQVHLTEQARAPARTYSGGMKRRLNLGCALVHDPVLLLLDEPTVGLDLPSREALFLCLDDLRARGCALVYTTHHLEEAQRTCDRVAILQRGRLRACESLAQLTSGRPASADGDWPGGACALEEVYRSLTDRSLPAA